MTQTPDQQQRGHTPGPWYWVDDGDLDITEMPKLRGAQGVEVCNFGDGTAYYPTEGEPPNLIDAALIAAAPELLDALRACWDLGIDSTLVPLVRSVIAKATGTTP